MSEPEKPTIDKVTLVPDQPLTEQEKQECTAFLLTYEPKITWEVGQKVTAYIDTKIINLYIRSMEPRNLFVGLLAEDGELHIAEHQQIGEPATQDKQTSPPFNTPRMESTGNPILIVYRVPPNTEIQVKIRKISE